MKRNRKYNMSSILSLRILLPQLLIYSITILMSISCTEKIDIKLDSTYARLVVEGYFTTDTTWHKVILTKSGDALNKKPAETISNAIVTISDGSNTFSLTENVNKKGEYLTDSTVYGVPGRIYTLNISNVDINGDSKTETYFSRSILKNEAPIDSFHIIYNSKNPGGKSWIFNMFAKDLGGGRNFYLMKLYKNKILMTDSAFKLYYITDNLGFEGGYFNGYSVYQLREERVDERLKPNDLLTLEMDGITEEYYNFLMDYILEYYPKMPVFSGPSANISTNIEPKDKAAGFFAVYSVSRKSKVYK